MVPAEEKAMKKQISMTRARWLQDGSVITIFILGLLAWSSPFAYSQLPASPAKNPQQIAILHWYAANQTTAFPAGNAPSDVAFDGANIWIADYCSNSVTKLRSSDGANLGSFAVGSSPWGIAFDGANIWVAN